MNKYLDITGLSEVAKLVHNLVDNSNLEKITYAKLVNKRNNGKLIPGKFYRIINFVTIVDSSNIYINSAGHLFDIIVLALGTNILSEEAYATLRPTTTYFRNCKLESWKIWYCLDNNVSRFSWCNTDYGKGVIYRMIDEYGNDCPYDFKNIQFLRLPFAYDRLSYPSYMRAYDNLYIYMDTVSFLGGPYGNPSKFFYTFSVLNEETNTIIDLSVQDYIDNVQSYHINSEPLCCNNIIKPSYANITFDQHDVVASQVLNNIVCLYQHNNDKFGGVRMFAKFHDNKFDINCMNMTFFDDMYNTIFGSHCSDNFGISCRHNIIKNSCTNNVLSYCESCIIGNESTDNIFDGSCNNIILGDQCKYNNFMLSHNIEICHESKNINIVNKDNIKILNYMMDYNILNLCINNLSILKPAILYYDHQAKTIKNLIP